jgi:4-diphosphocytidyl-2-C-methyl-D-erythritol kinase
MILFPPCKINLGLHILHKRSDGYHALDTLMFQVPFCDILEVVKSDDFQFTTSGLPIPGAIESNLCVQAFHKMKTRFGLSNVHIHLHKIIPMGGGLGGGSSDGTYVLLALNELFKLNLSVDVLQEIAAELGSDCPLFVVSKPQIAQGRGEKLEFFPLDLSGYYLKLVNIGIHVSTKEAFSNIQFHIPKKNIQALMKQPIASWKETVHNDFENTIFEMHPSLATLKEALYAEGAVYASMSGSGSTMYALYAKKPKLIFGKRAIYEKIIQL